MHMLLLIISAVTARHNPRTPYNMSHVPYCQVLLASISGDVDPRGGSCTGQTCVPRSPYSLGMEEWIPDVALIQGVPAFHVVHLPCMWEDGSQRWLSYRGYLLFT